MREVKAFIRHERATEVIQALRDNNFLSMTITEAEGTGRFTRPDDLPSLRFPVAHSKMVKLEIVCKKEDIKKVVKIISTHGSTGERGDGIIYVSAVEQVFKVRTGEESRDEL